jgi:signal transduction histidine kinase
VTTADPSSGSLAARAEDDVDDWDRQVLWWDVAFVAIVLLTAVALPLSGQSGRQLWIAYGAMATILAAYAAWGAPAARSRHQGRALAYVTVLVLATAVAVSQGGLATFLLFGAFTQLWMLLEPPRRAVLASVALAVTTTFGLAVEAGFSSRGLLAAAPQMAVALAFALTLGLWTATWMRRSDERAQLLQALRATQDELAQTHHAAGVAAERERVAREIHDTLAQGFTSVVTQAQAASAALDRGEDRTARERLDLIETTARENLAEARGLVAAFAPVPLQDSTLSEALRRLADRFTAETGTTVRVDVDGPVDASDDGGTIGPASDVVLLRAAQEALSNVRRHAGASAVTVRLRRADGAVELEVSDDGRGLPPQLSEGFGLTGMRERAAAAGGELEVGPGTAGGTRVRLRLPVSAS